MLVLLCTFCRSNSVGVTYYHAGISNFYGPSLETPVEKMREHYEVIQWLPEYLQTIVHTVFYQINVIGTLVLFPAAYPLLAASTPSPKFIPISTLGGSIADGASLPIGAAAYGSSKAAMNYLACTLHVQHPNLSKVFILD